MNLLLAIFIGVVVLLFALLAYAQIQSGRRELLGEEVRDECPECGGKLYADMYWVPGGTDQPIPFRCAECDERFDKQEIELEWVEWARQNGKW